MSVTKDVTFDSEWKFGVIDRNGHADYALSIKVNEGDKITFGPVTLADDYVLKTNEHLIGKFADKLSMWVIAINNKTGRGPIIGRWTLGANTYFGVQITKRVTAGVA